MTQAEKERLAKVGKAFNAKKYIKDEIEAIRAQVGDKKVLLAVLVGEGLRDAFDPRQKSRLE